MSDLQDIIAANAVRAYNEGFARGEASERERILEGVEQWRKDLLTGNRTSVVQDLISLIRGD